MGPGVISIQRETFKAFIAEGLDLVVRHGEEMNPHADIPLNIDEDTYIQADERGLLRVYTARLDGVLIGYAIFLVQFALNWKLSLTATQTAFYVDPELRMSTCGTRLLRQTERWLRDDGVQLIAQQQFVKHPQLGELLARERYKHSSNIWTKRLDKGE